MPVERRPARLLAACAAAAVGEARQEALARDNPLRPLPRRRAGRCPGDGVRLRIRVPTMGRESEQLGCFESSHELQPLSESLAALDPPALAAGPRHPSRAARTPPDPRHRPRRFLVAVGCQTPVHEAKYAVVNRDANRPGPAAKTHSRVFSRSDNAQASFRTSAPDFIVIKETPGSTGGLPGLESSGNVSRERWR